MCKGVYERTDLVCYSAYTEQFVKMQHASNEHFGNRTVPLTVLLQYTSDDCGHVPIPLKSIYNSDTESESSLGSVSRGSPEGLQAFHEHACSGSPESIREFRAFVSALQPLDSGRSEKKHPAPGSECWSESPSPCSRSLLSFSVFIWFSSSSAKTFGPLDEADW